MNGPFTLGSQDISVDMTTMTWVAFLAIKPTRCTNFSNVFLQLISTCFGQFLCPSSGVFHCTHSKPVWHIPLLCVQWKTADDGQRNCPKHVEINCKNTFEKLVHLVGFIIRIYHDARSPEHQFITMHGPLNINLSRCTVTWTPIYHDVRSPEHQFIKMQGHMNINLSRCAVTWTSI
jgi:hypothetical protein